MADKPIRMFGALWCPDCQRAKQFLTSHRIPYQWIDIEKDPGGAAYVQQVNNGKQIIPTIVFPDGSILVEPTNAELASKLRIETRATREVYELIIVGGGPAGLTAAIYAAREGLSTLVIEQSGLGGQAGTTQEIENYPGFPKPVKGAEFGERLARQAQRFGVEVPQAQQVEHWPEKMNKGWSESPPGTNTAPRRSFWPPAHLIAVWACRGKRISLEPESISVPPATDPFIKAIIP